MLIEIDGLLTAQAGWFGRRVIGEADSSSGGPGLEMFHNRVIR
jgi:hypothetical protein